MPTPDADPASASTAASTASAPWLDPCAVYLVATVSGSRYLIAETRNGRWWFIVRNVANARSRTVPVGIWEVAQPDHWPPVCGGTLALLAPEWMRHDDPARVPGGGKRTSLVMAVRPLDPAQWVAEAQAEDQLRRQAAADPGRTAVGVTDRPRHRIRLA